MRMGLNIVVQVEFVGVGAHADGVRFVFGLICDPEIDEFFGEDAALGQIFVIVFLALE